MEQDEATKENELRIWRIEQLRVQADELGKLRNEKKVRAENLLAR